MTGLPSLGPRGEGWVAVQGVLLALVAGGGLMEGSSRGALPVPLWIAGLLLLGAGGLLAVLGMLQLGTALSPFPRPRDDGRLVEGGVYRLARHPIYGGLVIAAAGYGLLLAAPVTATVGALVLLAFFRLKSAREEAWLEGRYSDYAAYRARTRRMLPFLY